MLQTGASADKSGNYLTLFFVRYFSIFFLLCISSVSIGNSLNTQTEKKGVNIAPVNSQSATDDDYLINLIPIIAAAAHKSRVCDPTIDKACITHLDSEGNILQNQSVLFDTNSIVFGSDNAKLSQNTDPAILRWEGVLLSGTGDYDFNINHGSGQLKVWIDDEIFYTSPPNLESYEGTLRKSLQAGEHRVKVEQVVSANSHFTIKWNVSASDCSVVLQNRFCGEYFNNVELSGSPVNISLTDNIDFDWAGNAPSESLPANYFSARWTGQFYFEEGSYTFRPTTDDGVRLWIDDELIVDYWRPTSAYERPGSIYLKSGFYQIKMEYFERTGYASAKLTWEKAAGCSSIPTNSFCGEYYNHYNFVGPVALLRNDDVIDFNWKSEAPDADVNTNWFSVRWQGNFDFAGGAYNLNVNVDDRIRIWINDQLILDGKDSFVGTKLETFEVPAGNHRVRIDYQERTSNARAIVNWTKANTCSGVPENQFCADYYPNKDLAGLPIHSGLTDDIDFNWGKDSPVPDVIGTDYFSIRWNGLFDFEEGIYNFNLRTDNGVRIWVGDDETPLIDSWDRGGTFHAEKALPAGKHHVKVEYREHSGSARAHVSWSKGEFCSDIPVNAFCGEYFPNNTFTGVPIYKHTDEEIAFDWLSLSPVEGVIPADKFGVRWQGYFDLEGDYRFVARGDDVIRVWVNDELIIDQPNYIGNKELYYDITLPAGRHLIKMEMQENVGHARAHLFWEERFDCTGTPDNAFCGSYYLGNALEGEVQRTYLSENINFDWGDVRPMHGISNNYYSVRWVGRFDFDEGWYRFFGHANEGIRVWIDDELIIDHWSKESRNQYNVQMTPWVSAGKHVVKVEYRENWGDASISLKWDAVTECNKAPQEAYCVEYYDGYNLETDIVPPHPVAVEKVNAINNDWGYERPHDMVWKDRFFARWKSSHYFNEGIYRFKTLSDDGVRLFIDGKEVINKWRYQGATPYYYVTKLSQGWHDLRLEYFENTSKAEAHLSWDSLPSCAEAHEDRFCSEYFNNTDFSGMPVDIQIVNQIDFDINYDAPSQYVNRDNFSIRSVGTFEFEEGLYRFHNEYAANDLVKITVNDEVVLDGWSNEGSFYNNGHFSQLARIPAGKHKVEVEYRDVSGKASNKVWWEKAPDCENDIPVGEFCATFFDGMELDAVEGTMLDTRIDSVIDFDWGSGYPYRSERLQNVPKDYFSVRWEGQFDFFEGEYTFHIQTDDGYRLWIDNQLLIDSWQDQGSTSYKDRIIVGEGRHTVKVEYYEKTGHAIARLRWEADQVNIPATPANLSAFEVRQDRVTLVWDHEELIDNYRIERDGEIIGNISSGTFTDETVVVNQTHSYKVTAIWPNGRESLSAEIQVTIPDDEAPTQPVNLAADVSLQDTITLSWDESTDNVAVAGYKIMRDGEEIDQVENAGTIDQALAGRGEHSYQIIAYDAAGNNSIASDTLTVTTSTVDNIGPTIPAGLTAIVTSDDHIQLDWNASRDGSGVKHYIIERNGTKLGTTPVTSYVDTSVLANIPYIYKITAVDVSDNPSIPSDQVTVIINGDKTAPSAPMSLEATVPDGQSINLLWEPAIDNQGVKHYKIIRDGRLLALANTAYYLDSNLQDGHTYSYQVKAVDDAGNVSLPSNEVEASLSKICDSTQQFYEQSVANVVSATCATCHVAGGEAQTTRLVFTTGENADARNLGILNTFSKTVGKDYILNKVSMNGLLHGGGLVFPRGESNWLELEDLLTRLESTESCTDDGNAFSTPILTHSLAQNCSSCHGPGGRSTGPATPTISGLGSVYIEKTMLDYQTGARYSTVMNRIAKGYTADEIKTLAEYFSSEPYQVATQTPDTTLADQGKLLHDQHCASCHASEGRSNVLTGTRLAGQWQPYLLRTLQDFAHIRSEMSSGMATAINNVFGTDGEQGLKALAAFYASIPAGNQAPDKPEELAIASYTTDMITLSWMGADDDWDIAYYEIYRDGVLVGTTTFSVYTDTGLLPGGYNYTVVAVDIEGNRSIVSDTVHAQLVAENVSPEGVQLLDYRSTLRKASLILLGRLPTDKEYAAVKSEEEFRETLRIMLETEGALDNFAWRAGHEAFLGSGSVNFIFNIDFPAIDTVDSQVRNIAIDTIRREPVYLLQHILDEDRPWTEILTADYTVVNPQLATVFGATPVDGSFTDISDSTEFHPVTINRLSARLPDKSFPHAGVLTTQAWLSRFPTTDTNRNRHRAASLFKQFLALDIESLAQRPLDDSNNDDYLVPTMENPNCTACHTTMEPVAGAFRNWGTIYRYAQNFDGSNGDQDSMDNDYKSNRYPLNHSGERWYQEGDLWYRDMFAPGMNDKQMPGGYQTFEANEDSEATDSLQWLAKHVVEDTRFAKGGVHFWYRTLFKREPLTAPVNPEAEGYDEQMAAYNEQDALLEELANRFTKDNGHGAWNVKDLLIDMVSGPLFRAGSGVLSASEKETMSDFGLARLLTPEELNRKLQAVTGYSWRNFEDSRVWNNRSIGLFYGGFDGGRDQVVPNSEMNGLMSKIPDRMALELSCNMVRNEFRTDVAQRRLFTLVEQTDSPVYDDGTASSTNMLLNPGAEDGLTNWTIDEGTVRILTGSRGCNGGPSIKSGANIFNPGSICEGQTPIGRIYQDVSLAERSDQIDLGTERVLFGAALRGWSSNNDVASVYLGFLDASGEILGHSDVISSSRGYWVSPGQYATVPVGTRSVRFYIEGRNLGKNTNTDAFADDAYLSLVRPDSGKMTIGERRIRENLQFLHRIFLDEALALDDPELDRSFDLFSEIWSDRGSTENAVCRLYNDSEDPNYTKRAWSMVIMYLMTDARFLYE